LLLGAAVLVADFEDRDCGILLMTALFVGRPMLRKLYADLGNQGQFLQRNPQRLCSNIKLEIIRRRDSRNFIVWLNTLGRRANHGMAEPLS
jgi:hypothetical protein